MSRMKPRGQQRPGSAFAVDLGIVVGGTAVESCRPRGGWVERERIGKKVKKAGMDMHGKKSQLALGIFHLKIKRS